MRPIPEFSSVEGFSPTVNRFRYRITFAGRHELRLTRYQDAQHDQVLQLPHCSYVFGNIQGEMGLLF